MTTARKNPIKYRRGKPIPALRHGDRVDWSTFPLHSRPKGRRIERCPECGRKGEQSLYGGGSSHYTHMSRYETLVWMVIDSCYIKAASVPPEAPEHPCTP